MELQRNGRVIIPVEFGRRLEADTSFRSACEDGSITYELDYDTRGFRPLPLAAEFLLVSLDWWNKPLSARRGFTRTFKIGALTTVRWSWKCATAFAHRDGVVVLARLAGAQPEALDKARLEELTGVTIWRDTDTYEDLELLAPSHSGDGPNE